MSIARKLAALRTRMDPMCEDKLDGKIELRKAQRRSTASIAAPKLMRSLDQYECDALMPAAAPEGLSLMLV